MHESNQSEKEIIEIPIVPIRNIVVFPHMTIPFFIGRKQSIEALEDALAADRKIYVVCQKDPHIETPTENDLYDIGTIGNILQIMRLPKRTIKVLFEGERERGRIVETDLESGSYRAQVEVLPTVENYEPELLTLTKTVKSEFKPFLKKTASNTDSSEKILSGDYSPGQIADMIAPLLTMEIAKQQEMLSTLDSRKRLEKVYSRMLEEEEHKKIEQKLKERVQGQIGKTQKEYYLNEQMKAIQKELGSEDGKEEIDEFEEGSGIRNEQVGLGNRQKELKKLKMMPPTSSEANIVRNFVDWLTSVPWKAKTDDNLSLEHAQEVLDEDHYGLEKVKERIIEYIAVANLVGNLRGPIICLVGPPGVGKSSLARSIARSLDRNFVRMSLGGVRDEAEIRGHRRTYIGALPGKIIQSMKKAKTNNPVLLLDEIDKMAQSHMGDPASALLEVLDPEQNHEFMDHYLEVEYDLSNVMFICTANVKHDIPLPLIDRMEIINLTGYSEFEKEKIASKYLIPKQMTENGLKDDQLDFKQEGLLEVIRSYTREAGVRTLERTIAKVCRKAVTQIVKENLTDSIELDAPKINEYLGVKQFRHEKVDEQNEIGIITGLAWTSFGGEILTIEVNTMKGSGKIQLTGKLGDVMKESAQAAHSWVRSNANLMGIYSKVFTELDIHVHVPEGATPKDGPSAGIAISCAMVSALTGIPIKKAYALTGEITLRGKVLPIGGLKEKLLAAKREGIFKVLIPKENEKDLVEVPDEIKEGLEITTLKHVRKAIDLILERVPQAVKDDELDGQLPEDSDKVIQSNVGGFPSDEPTISHN